MRRRTLLGKVSTASILAVGATATAGASGTGPESVADADALVTTDDAGERVVLDLAGVEDRSELDAAIGDDDPCRYADCTRDCCSDCPSVCWLECGGCLCDFCTN